MSGRVTDLTDIFIEYNFYMYVTFSYNILHRVQPGSEI